MKKNKTPQKGTHVFHKTGIEYIFVREQGKFWWVLTDKGFIVSFHRNEFKGEKL